jgi:hypothetical protein
VLMTVHIRSRSDRQWRLHVEVIQADLLGGSHGLCGGKSFAQDSCTRVIATDQSIHHCVRFIGDDGRCHVAILLIARGILPQTACAHVKTWLRSADQSCTNVWAVDIHIFHFSGNPRFLFRP